MPQIHKGTLVLITAPRCDAMNPPEMVLTIIFVWRTVSLDLSKSGWYMDRHESIALQSQNQCISQLVTLGSRDIILNPEGSTNLDPIGRSTRAKVRDLELKILREKNWKSRKITIVLHLSSPIMNWWRSTSQMLSLRLTYMAASELQQLTSMMEEQILKIIDNHWVAYKYPRCGTVSTLQIIQHAPI